MPMKGQINAASAMLNARWATTARPSPCTGIAPSSVATCPAKGATKAQPMPRTIRLPTVRRRAVVSTQYNTTSLLRTMEQILGLPPMNQFDASAVPMGDCFTDAADLTPYAAVPSNVPLDQMNPEDKKTMTKQQVRDALASEKMNFSVPDKAPEDTLNRILWRAMRGEKVPYPEWAITLAADDDD